MIYAIPPNQDRRRFLKRSLLLSAGLAAAVTFEHRPLIANSKSDATGARPEAALALGPGSPAHLVAPTESAPEEYFTAPEVCAT
ncbi:MAG: hypothetical protein AAB225_04755, partial [Acidobacteriota bacterium]